MVPLCRPNYSHPYVKPFGSLSLTFMHGAISQLSPARASERGNVIGSVSVSVCVQKEIVIGI